MMGYVVGTGVEDNISGRKLRNEIRQGEMIKLWKQGLVEITRLLKMRGCAIEGSMYEDRK